MSGARSDPLDTLCRSVMQATDACGAAVTMMTTGGHRGVAWASSRPYVELEDLQFTLGEGPGIAAFADQTTVMATHLNAVDAPQWPAWAPAVTSAGVQAVFAFPLRIGSIELGSLSVYRDRPGPMTPEQIRQLLGAADTVAVLVLDRVVQTSFGPAVKNGAADHAHHDLFRASVNQAAGMVSVQLNVGVDEALARIRAHAFATGRPITELAQDILDHTLRLEKDSPGRDA